MGLKRLVKRIEHKVVKPAIKVHAKILGPIVTGTRDPKKQKQRLKIGLAAGAIVATGGAGALGKAALGASLTRRANPQPQPAEAQFNPADTMLGQPENPTVQMYASTTGARPEGLIAKMVNFAWSIFVPPRR